MTKSGIEYKLTILLKPKNEKIQDKMNILIIKIGALGDVVRTSFIAQALKEKYNSNNPKIFWITSDKAKPLFINNPYIYRIIDEKNKNMVSDIFFDFVQCGTETAGHKHTAKFINCHS